VTTELNEAPHDLHLLRREVAEQLVNLAQQRGFPVLFPPTNAVTVPGRICRGG
jgi:hypothetical protein